MIYTAKITTLAKRYKTNLLKTEINVNKGLVYKVEFYFPPGPAGLVGVAVFDGLYQVWPSSVGEYFASDDETISFDDLFLKDAAPFKLQVYTYNEDTEHAHVVGVRIGLVSDVAFMARFVPNKSRDDFEKLRARLQKERAERQATQLEMAEGTLLEKLIKEAG